MNKVKFNPWLIILGSIGCSGLLITLSNTDGLYLGPVIEEFGWNRTSASLYMTIYNWVAALMQPLVGKIFEKRDMRKIMAGVIVLSMEQQFYTRMAVDCIWSNLRCMCRILYVHA